MAQKTPSSVSEEGLCSVRYYEKKVTLFNIINLYLPFLKFSGELSLYKTCYKYFCIVRTTKL